MFQQPISQSNMKNNYKIMAKICAIVIFIGLLFIFVGLFNQKFFMIRNEGNHIQESNNNVRLLATIEQYSARQTNERKFNKKVYNQQNLGGIFPFKDKLTISVDIPQISTREKNRLKQLGFLDKIIVGSYFDYLNLTGKLDFQKLSQQFYNLIPYQEITLPFDETLDKLQLPKVQMNKFGKGQKDDDVFEKIIGVHPSNKSFQFELARKMFFSSEQPAIKQAQYRYYDNRYNIGKYKQQKPICIFSPGGKLVPKNNYRQYFQYMQKQNYTNFHIVYVYDNAPQQQIQVIIDYLQKNKFKFNNRIKIIHTFTRLDVLGNMYFFINRYCQTDDIVISVDADDALFGTQPLKVINAVYQDPKVWAGNSVFIYYDKINNELSRGNQSGNRTQKAEDYRTSFKWETSHIRTFYKKLYEKVPLYMNLQYHLNLTSSTAYPTFYSYAPDAFQMFNIVELAGDQHYVTINDYLYYYTGVGTSDPKNCYVGHAPYDAHKSRLKTPFNNLQTLEQPAVHVKGYIPPYHAQKITKNAYQTYLQCNQHWKNQPHPVLITAIIVLGIIFSLIGIFQLFQMYRFQYVQIYSDFFHPTHDQPYL